MNIRKVLEKMITSRASDLHLKAGTPPIVRVDGVLYTLDDPAPSAQELREVCNQLLNEEQRLYFSTHHEIDFAFGVSGLARFRANVFMQRNTPALALRHVPVEVPSIEDWPKITWTPSAQSRRVDLDTLTRADVRNWKQGETLLLSGKMLTGRDAAHKRIEDMLAKGEKLPVAFTNRVIYYVGPVDPVRNEVVGPAGPTTATRMDKFTEMMLGKTGLAAMIGKGERGPAAIEAIRKHQAASLIAVGGAAFLVAKAIRSSRVLAFADLGMEAIYEFDVKDMPVTVAVDARGDSVHQSGPAEWEKRIREFRIPVALA